MSFHKDRPSRPEIPLERQRSRDHRQHRRLSEAQSPAGRERPSGVRNASRCLLVGHPQRPTTVDAETIGHVGARHGRGADARAGDRHRRVEHLRAGGASAGAPAHDRPTATGAAISYAIPALGAVLSAPERPVLCPHPDKPAMDTTSGLCAPARENLDVTTVTDNNGADDMVRIEPQRLGAGSAPGPRRPTSLICSHTGFRQTRRGYGSRRTSRPHRQRARRRPPRRPHPTRTAPH